MLLFLERVQHLLDAFLEVAAVARAGDEGAQVQGKDTRRLQGLGHVARMDAKGQALGERRLADAGFTDEQRVVLAAPAEHLDHALDLVLAANQRIDLPARRLGHEVRRIGLQRLARRGGLAIPGSRHARLVPAVGDGAQERQPIEPLLAQEVRGVAVLLLEQEDEQGAGLHLAGTGRGRVDDGTLHDPVEADGGLGLDGPAPGYGGEGPLQHLVEVRPQAHDIHATAFQQSVRLAVLEQRGEQVLEADEVVSAVRRHAEGTADALECFGSEGYGLSAHGCAPSGSGSTVTRSGNSCSSASFCVACCRVSATSRV